MACVDLSFNNLEKIEGLSALVKLEDLILFNNRIEVINNLDSLKNLQVLSIGNNAIKELETVGRGTFLLYRPNIILNNVTVRLSL